MNERKNFARARVEKGNPLNVECCKLSLTRK
jgi:hypothetical protein